MRRWLFSPFKTVVGLDLSLQAAAACAIPLKWKEHDMLHTRTIVVGYGVKDSDGEEVRLERLDKIAKALVEFCDNNHAVAIGVEDYAFSQGQSRAHALGEIGGVTKLALYKKLNVIPTPIVASTARKTLLQKLPGQRGMKKGFMKKFVAHNVRRLEGPTLKWGEDEIDAFVIANHRRMIEGEVPMSFLGEMP